MKRIIRLGIIFSSDLETGCYCSSNIFLIRRKANFPSGFVPISLLVTLEMVKVFQGIVMRNDPKMTSRDDIKTSVQSSNLNEELGQINYVFSDKTGTLTQNLMEFKNICIGQRSYGTFTSSNKCYSYM